MNNKKFIISVFSATTFFVFLVSLFNFIIDPFQQYRKPTLYKTFYGGNQRALNTGLARHHDYNSIIIGSSMTENFLISKSSEILPNPIKLSISGGSAYEIFLTLNTAFETGKEINAILIGFDIYAMSGKITRLMNGDNSLPMYLYDEMIFNDIFYLANFDTLKESIKRIIAPYSLYRNDPRWNYENMYQSQHFYEKEFGRDKVLTQIKDKKNDKNFKKDDYSFQTLKASFEHNFLSIIKKHPNTKFILFYPPYSIIAYKGWKENDTLQDILDFKKYAFAELNKLDNVELYDFQTADEVTTNLDNYRDFSHYHQNINSWMIDEIKAKKYLVTQENIDQHLQNLKNQIKAYDLNKSAD